MRCTTRAPVSGSVQRSTILGTPPRRATCSIITHTLRAPTARSIAPPTAGIASGVPVSQLARSPSADTW